MSLPACRPPKPLVHMRPIVVYRLGGWFGIEKKGCNVRDVCVLFANLNVIDAGVEELKTIVNWLYMRVV